MTLSFIELKNTYFLPGWRKDLFNQSIFNQETAIIFYLSGSKRIPKWKNLICFEAIRSSSQLLISAKQLNRYPQIRNEWNSEGATPGNYCGWDNTLQKYSSRVWLVLEYVWTYLVRRNVRGEWIISEWFKNESVCKIF